MIQRLQAIRKRGFNLIEAAIVLGVVGAVVGGIWTAASSVIENFMIGKVERDIEITVSHLQSKVSISASEQMGSINLNPYMIAAGLYPSDWINGTNVKSPYGKDAYIWNNGNGWFDFKIYVSTKSQCFRLLKTLFKRKGMLGMSYLQTHTKPVNFFSLGYVPSDSCADEGERISVTFPYIRNNY